MNKESYIEKKTCDYAKEQGFLQYKFSSPNKKAVPDRIFMKDGNIFFIEFKSEKGKLTKLQEREIKKINEQKIKAYTCNSIESCKLIINNNL